jgi:hypothetical protein
MHPRVEEQPAALVAPSTLLGERVQQLSSAASVTPESARAAGSTNNRETMTSVQTITTKNEDDDASGSLPETHQQLVFDNLAAQLKRRMDAHYDMIRAIHRESLREVATEIVDAYLPKGILDKAGALDDALAELKQLSKVDIKAEVRACVKEFIWRDIKKEPKEVKALEEKVAQLEPLAIKLTNENAALMKRSMDLESANTELRNKINALDNGYLTLADDIANMRAQSARTAAFVNTRHGRLGYPFVPGI